MSGLRRGQAVVDGRKVLPRDTEADLGGVDDMTKLVYLHEPGVLCNLARRYTLNEIYVSVPTFSTLSMISQCPLVAHWSAALPSRVKGGSCPRVRSHVSNICGMGETVPFSICVSKCYVSSEHDAYMGF